MWMPHLNSMINNVLNGAWSIRSSNGVEITQVTPTISIVILSFLLCMFMFWQPWKRTALPPGPRGLPIVGYLPFNGTDFLHQWTELARQYGPIYKMKMGNKLWVIVSSPSIAKELTRDQDMIFVHQDPTVALSILITRGLGTSALDPHSSFRRNMRKIFLHVLLRKSSIDAAYDLRKVEFRKAIKLLSSKVGRPIDIGQLMRTTTIEFLMAMAWGRTFEADERRKVCSELSALLQKTEDLLMKPNISDHFPMVARFDIQGIEKDSKAVSQSFEEIIDRLINISMEKMEAKAGDKKKDFIQLLLELRESEEFGAQLGIPQIKTIVQGFFFVGTATTASTAKSVMTEIVRNREVMQKVQKELEAVIGLNNIVEEFHLPRLKYLDAVVKETLRLYPTIPLIGRSASQSCTLGGYTIPKYTKICVSVWAMQRDPQLWENSLDFQPERFLNEPGKWDFCGKDLRYIPFGSGRRICPGVSLAERVFMYILASLLHSFDWRETETKEADLSVSGNRKTLIAIPTKRLPDSGLYT